MASFPVWRLSRQHYSIFQFVFSTWSDSKPFCNLKMQKNEEHFYQMFCRDSFGKESPGAQSATFPVHFEHTDSSTDDEEADRLQHSPSDDMNIMKKEGKESLTSTNKKQLYRESPDDFTRHSRTFCTSTRPLSLNHHQAESHFWEGTDDTLITGFDNLQTNSDDTINEGKVEKSNPGKEIQSSTLTSMFRRYDSSDELCSSPKHVEDKDVEFLKKTLQSLGANTLSVLYLPKGKRTDSLHVGIFCKNLFLKDRKGQFYLIICHEDDSVDLKQLKKKLTAYRNFSFATADDMKTVLHVHPGAVTPFTMMHESARAVRVAITSDLLLDPEAMLNFHPLYPNLTLPISVSHLQTFLRLFHHKLEIL